MKTIKNLMLTVVFITAGLILASCGKKGAGADAQSFDQAPAEIKADWNTAVAADKANDYFTASTAYSRVMLQEAKLSPKQFEAVRNASSDLSQRMIAAADGGDEAAKAARAKLMAAQNQR